MKVKSLFFLFISTSLLSFTVHKYYLSLTQINFKKEAKSIQIITNVFMDDIELAINEDNNIDLQLKTTRELKNSDFYFKKYLKEKLQFKVNDTLKNFNYIGKEYDGDLVFFYLEIENIEFINSLEVSNKILINHFLSQQNLVKSNINKKNKSFILDIKKTKVNLIN